MIDTKQLIDFAYKNLQEMPEIDNSYHRGILAAALAIAEELRKAHQPQVTREDIENKPEMKPAKVEAPAEKPAEKPAEPEKAPELQSLTPQNEKSQKVANIMSEAAKKVGARIQEMHEAKAPAKEEASAPTAEAPAAPAEAPKVKEQDDAYYDSDEWKNKHLTSDELDATWTPRMQKNAFITLTARKLQQFIGWCQAGNMPQGWIDQAITNVSDKRYTSANDKRIYSPQMVQFILAGLQGEYNKSRQQQAA